MQSLAASCTTPVLWPCIDGNITHLVVAPSAQVEHSTCDEYGRCMDFYNISISKQYLQFFDDGPKTL